MKNKVVVLLSAGLDSSVNLLQAAKEDEVLAAINIDYGQRAAKQERKAARLLCDKLNVPLIEFSLDIFKTFEKNALTNTALSLAQNMDINDLAACKETAKNVWVPNRNGVLLNLAAALAENLGADYVIPGFNKEEAATFADNSKDYMQALDKAFSYSTQNAVKVKCYTVDMAKPEIYELGKRLGMDETKLWYCYESGDVACRKCESCLRFENARSLAK